MNHKETFLKSNIQAIIALILIVGGLYGLLFNSSTTDIKIAIVGLMTGILQYYFGSSKASTEKDKTISDLSDKNKNNDNNSTSN